MLQEKKKTFGQPKLFFLLLLAHLSRRLIGELIVYYTQLSVRPSTFSKDISSEAMMSILTMFYYRAEGEVGGRQILAFFISTG